MDAAHTKTLRKALRQSGLTAGSVALTAILLSGCSSVPDAVNPVEWYRGATEVVTGRSSSKEAREAAARKVEERDYPDSRVIPERPRILSPEERKDIANGLVSDRANAKYTQDRINREGNPTRPLTPKPATVEEAPAGAAPPAAAEQPAPPPAQLAPGGGHSQAQPAPGTRPQQVAQRPMDPVATPPAVEPARTTASPVSMTPVAAPTPAPVPVAAAAPQRQPSPVEDVMRRRLAQSAPATGTVLAATAPAAEAMPATPAAMATPRVTQVTLDFTPGRASIDEGYLDDLDDLADAAKRSGSRILIVAGAQPAANSAKATSQALAIALKRAEAVSIELRRSGVAADRIDISTGNDGDKVRVGLI